MPGGELRDFLEVMQRRGYLLAAMGDEASTKPELETALDVSRSTIDRGIRELESAALIERTGDGFRRTLPGRLAFREYEAFARRVAGLREGATLLAALSPDAAFDLAMLEGATVVETERSSPHKPIEALYGVVESASSVKGFAPAVHPQQVATYSEEIQKGMAAELVLTDGVIERLIGAYAEEFEVATASDRVDVYETTGELPYSLTIARTDDGAVAAVMVYADDGIRGCIINDDEAAVEWAERRYQSVREGATRLS